VARRARPHATAERAGLRRSWHRSAPSGRIAASTRRPRFEPGHRPPRASRPRHRGRALPRPCPLARRAHRWARRDVSPTRPRRRPRHDLHHRLLRLAARAPPGAPRRRCRGDLRLGAGDQARGALGGLAAHALVLALRRLHLAGDRRREPEPRVDLRRRARDDHRGDRSDGARGAAREPGPPQPRGPGREAARHDRGRPARVGGPGARGDRLAVRRPRPGRARLARPLLLLRAGRLGQPGALHHGRRGDARGAPAARPRGLPRRPARPAVGGARRPRGAASRPVST
jgi:hypothetical protein